MTRLTFSHSLHIVSCTVCVLKATNNPMNYGFFQRQNILWDLKSNMSKSPFFSGRLLSLLPLIRAPLLLIEEGNINRNTNEWRNVHRLKNGRITSHTDSKVLYAVQHNLVPSLQGIKSITIWPGSPMTNRNNIKLLCGHKRQFGLRLLLENHAPHS